MICVAIVFKKEWIIKSYLLKVKLHRITENYQKEKFET